MHRGIRPRLPRAPRPARLLDPSSEGPPRPRTTSVYMCTCLNMPSTITRKHGSTGEFDAGGPICPDMSDSGPKRFSSQRDMQQRVEGDDHEEQREVHVGPVEEP